MRIIGGKYKGRRISVSRTFASRPTTDFARENLFNILANRFDFSEVHFLDLFAGTGSIGFEMHSRGCVKAELVEIERRTVRHLTRIIEEFGMEGVRAVCMDAFKYIEVCRDRYHIVFADPPYNMSRTSRLPDLILNAQLLHPQGRFILEHSGKLSFRDHPNFSEERHYGNVRFSFFSGNVRSATAILS